MSDEPSDPNVLSRRIVTKIEKSATQLPRAKSGKLRGIRSDDLKRLREFETDGAAILRIGTRGRWDVLPLGHRNVLAVHGQSLNLLEPVGLVAYDAAGEVVWRRQAEMRDGYIVAPEEERALRFELFQGD